MEEETVELPSLALPGSSQDTINLAAVIILSVVVGCTLLGLGLDYLLCRKRIKGPPDSRPRGWVVGMLVSSYTLLAPGLFATLFCWKVAAMNGFKVLNESEENMVGFASLLFSTGSVVGGLAVVSFAMVIPVAKLILLMLGGVLRHSKIEARVVWARRAISSVQKISKWASPDMFAYILLLYLIRGLDHPPLLNGIMQLDVGFICFSIFCVASTVASLGVRMPEVKARNGKMRQPPPTLWVVFFSIGISVAFAILLALGATKPCMALRLDMDLLCESGIIDSSLAPIVKAMGIQDMAADDVSLLECTRDLWSWIPGERQGEDQHTYEAFSAIAFLMLALFVFVFTLADMLALLVAAVMLHATGRRPTWALEFSHVFRKLSMLDVCVVGVVIVVLAGSIYRSIGVILSMRIGLLFAALAELCHYVLYYVVWHAADAFHELELDPSECDVDGPLDDLEDMSSEDQSEDPDETDVRDKGFD